MPATDLPSIKATVRNDQILTWLIANPGAKLQQCAAHFQVTPSWLSQIINSDSFRAQVLEASKDLQINVLGGLKSRLSGLADLCVEKLTDAVFDSQSPEFILQTTDKVLHRLGYAPNTRPSAAPVQVNTQLVVTSDVLAAAKAQILGSSTGPASAAHGHDAVEMPALLAPPSADELASAI